MDNDQPNLFDGGWQRVVVHPVWNEPEMMEWVEVMRETFEIGYQRRLSTRIGRMCMSVVGPTCWQWQDGDMVAHTASGVLGWRPLQRKEQANER